nr:reverse transcriptase domain-containing protein [Tanacetum cinerariifolium]
MMIATVAFMRGETAAASKKKGHGSWKPHDQSKKHANKRLDFRGHSRDSKGASRFTPLTRTPKEILVAEANKFQPPTPMVTPIEKRNSNKFCDFHNDKGHSTDECMQLKKHIEELVRAGKLSHLIKEMKQGREQPKTGRKEVVAKDKPTPIYMVRSWQRTVKQKITQSFEQGKKITFPPLTTYNRTEGPLVIEAEMGGHTIHRMYIDDGSSMEILYEYCFNQLRPEIKSQMVPATTSLTWFSDETTWPLGQLNLLVTIGDATHSTKEWMNFMVVKSLSPYNGIIGRPGLKAIQAVPSTVHGMLKFPTKGGIVTIRRSLPIPAECTSIDTSSPIPTEKKTRPANLTVPLHPNFPDQEVVVGDRYPIKDAPTLPLLAAPKPQEEMIMYLSATHGAISTVLMTERGIVQTLVYFISRALQGPELNYSPIEKLVLSLVFAAKRLRRYFQAHPITTFLTKCRAMPHKACQSQRRKKNRGRCLRTARRV